MGIQVAYTESQPIPAGLYTATIESCEKAEGKFGPQLKVKFVLEDEEWAGRSLSGWASLTFSPKSKLYSWVRAAVFGGRDVPDHYKAAGFDADHLVGRRVLISVDVARADTGESYNRIKDVLPWRRVAAPKPPAQPPAAATRAVGAEPDDWPPLDETALDEPPDEELF